MNREMTLSVLGEEDSDILQNNIINLTNICMSIKDALNLKNPQENICSSLSTQSFYPKRIEVTSDIIKNIKLKLDIRYKHETSTIEINEVRVYIIGLFSNLDDMSLAITNRNDALLKKYNDNIIQLISDYN